MMGNAMAPPKQKIAMQVKEQKQSRTSYLCEVANSAALYSTTYSQRGIESALYPRRSG